MSDLTGRTIAFLVAPEGIEQIELTEPWKAVEDAGGTPKLLSTRSGEVQAFHHLDKADTFPVDALVADADPASYDGLMLPGAWRTPTHCVSTRTPWRSSATSSSPTDRWRRSVTHHGPSPRPTWSAGSG
jgi:putative intracellular protease/amidase